MKGEKISYKNVLEEKEFRQNTIVDNSGGHCWLLGSFNRQNLPFLPFRDTSQVRQHLAVQSTSL